MRIKPLPATFALGLGTLISHGFGLSLVPAMLPRIDAEFQSGYGVLGVAVATGLIAYAVGSLLAPPILRVIPTRALLVWTFALTGTGFVVSALASSPIFISAAVILLGISAPISWTATIHIARESVSPDSLSIVNAGASGGAAVGVILNGVLVSTSGSIHGWRVSFWVAALAAAITIVITLLVFREPIAKPGSSKTSLLTVFRRVLADRSGRMIVATSAVSGIAVFTLATFLTATSIDEMGASDTATASLLWIAGTVGVISAFVLGRFGDKRTPILAIAIAMASYAATLVVLLVGWSYPVLVVAVVGYGILNGPVWGLMGATASRRFSAEMAVGTIALGLAGASLIGAVGNSLAGWWIETTGSMRGPVLVLALLTSGLTIYLTIESIRTTASLHQ